MYFTSEVQTAVKIGCFKNIAVKQPCELIIRVSIYHYDYYQGKIYATPVSIVKCEKLKNNTTDEGESQINYAENTYWSKKIRIRYQDQLTQISQICIFRTKIDAFQQQEYKARQIYLLCQLMFVSKQQYITISKFEGKANNLTVNIFIPVYFDQYRFTSSLDVQLHSKSIGFKFMDNRQSIKQIIRSQTSPPKKKHIQIHKQLKIPMQFRSFMDFLSFATKKFDKCEIQKFYDKYMNNLKYEIESIKTQLINFMDKLQRKQQIELLNMNLMNKIKKKIPSAPFIKKKKRIFDRKSSAGLEIEQQNNSKISELDLNPKLLEQYLLTEFNVLGGIIYQLWRELINLFKTYPNINYSKNKKEVYFSALKQFYLKKYTTIETIKNLKFEESLFTPFFFANNQIQNKFLLSKEYLYLTKDYKKKRHLIIFVHGFQAFGLDMQSIRNYVQFQYPECELFISTINQNKTDNKLQYLGQRFALEFKNHINTNNFNLKENLKISFICHSMGSLIVRAAFPYLNFFKQYFYHFISLSSPHLGYLYHSSTLIKTSLWVLNKMNKCSSMLELCFQDKPKLEECYLYQLSQIHGLEWFQSIILFGSREDEYVPFHSAMLDVPQDYIKNKQQNAIIYKKMIENLTKNVSKTKIIRIEAHFENIQKDFNAMIGRSAHIQLLGDKDSIKIFINLFSYIFS